MCVKIVKDSVELPYDCDRPIEDQIDGYTEIRVNYRPNDHDVGVFLQDLQRCVKDGSGPRLNLKVDYNGFLKGFQIKKKLQAAISDITFNEIIKLMVLSQAEADKKLEELSDLCLNRKCNG